MTQRAFTVIQGGKRQDGHDKSVLPTIEELEALLEEGLDYGDSV